MSGHLWEANTNSRSDFQRLSWGWVTCPTSRKIWTPNSLKILWKLHPESRNVGDKNGNIFELTFWKNLDLYQCTLTLTHAASAAFSDCWTTWNRFCALFTSSSAAHLLPAVAAFTLKIFQHVKRKHYTTCWVTVYCHSGVTGGWGLPGSRKVTEQADTCGRKVLQCSWPLLVERFDCRRDFQLIRGIGGRAKKEKQEQS